jgi:hypothetical protein
VICSFQCGATSAAGGRTCARGEVTNVELTELFRAHGVTCEEDGEWIVFPRKEMRAQARIFDPPVTETIQLDVDLEIWPGWLLVESFAGYAGLGKDRAASIANAFEAFALASLPVLLSAFLLPRPLAGVDREEWLINGRPRILTLGTVLHRGQNADPSWFADFEKAIKTSALSEGTHWIRLYYGQLNRKPMVHKALLDNEPWPEIQRAMERFDWWTGDDFHSARLFLVVQGGVGIGQACSVISRSKNATEDLVALGMTEARATLLYSLITLAFGRTVLQKMGLTLADQFWLLRADGARERCALADYPIYTEALAVAQTRRQLSKEQVRTIAWQSPELRAVNEALKADSNFNNLPFVMPEVVLPD